MPRPTNFFIPDEDDEEVAFAPRSKTSATKSLTTTNAASALASPSAPSSYAAAYDLTGPAAPTTPTTPSKRVAALGLDNTPAKRTKGRLTPPPASAVETPGRKRKVPGKPVNTPKTIATTMDQLAPLDRRMVQMKDNGSSWKEINQMWAEETGESAAKSTLPNRYARLKSNLTSMAEEDQVRLAEAKAWVEDELERSKWERIQQRMSELGVETRYSIVSLQKQWERMEAAAARADQEDDYPE